MTLIRLKCESHLDGNQRGGGGGGDDDDDGGDGIPSGGVPLGDVPRE